MPGDHMKDGWGVPSSSRVLTLPGPFSLDSGASIPEVTLAFNTYGQLNPAGDNVAIVGHSLTSNSCIHEWWPQLMGEGESFALDTGRYFVICVNYLGSVYGSDSPLTRNPSTGERYAASFPVMSIRDNVRLQRALLDALGVKRIALAIGGSLGGMLALEWAATFPEFVDELVVVAAPACHAGWAIGINEVERQAIYADPRWMGGWYDLSDPPLAGMAVARQLAMVTYRSPQSFDAKFGRSLRPGAPAIATPLQPSAASSGSLSSRGSGGGGANSNLHSPPSRVGALGSPSYAVAEGSPVPLGHGASGMRPSGASLREAFSLGEAAMQSAAAAPALPSPQPPQGAPLVPRSQYEVEAYLRYQGEKFVRRFDPLCYVRLTQTLDTHNVGAGRSAPVGEEDGVAVSASSPAGVTAAVRSALSRLPQRTLVVGIDSDLLYPVSGIGIIPPQVSLRSRFHNNRDGPLRYNYPPIPPPLPALYLQLDLQRSMAEAIPRSQLYVISSPHGHDSFLIEIAQLNSAIVAWLRQR